MASSRWTRKKVTSHKLRNARTECLDLLSALQSLQAKNRTLQDQKETLVRCLCQTASLAQDLLQINATGLPTFFLSYRSWIFLRAIAGCSSSISHRTTLHKILTVLHVPRLLPPKTEILTSAPLSTRKNEWKL